MGDHTALIVDDEPDIQDLLCITLSRLGLDVITADSVADALRLLKTNSLAFCLTDMRLPDGDGLNLVDHVIHHHPELPIAVITAHGNTDLAVEALKRGAFDFLTKPVQLSRLRAMVGSALALRAMRQPCDDRPIKLIGTSAAIIQLRERIRRVARSQAPVFISGESGSGKELVARSVHYDSPRANGPFIAVNCGAIPPDLIESELFGHRKGSFTGAHQHKVGLFQAADGGTLFLDEIADLPLSMQVKLLRGIQEKSVRAVGSDQEVAVDIRILSATHKNLGAEVGAGRFRQDLYYRINVIEISVPPLRHRTEDIQELAERFLQRSARSLGVPKPDLTPRALEALKSYTFPGNVRELENLLERALTLCDSDSIDAENLHLSEAVNLQPTTEILQHEPSVDISTPGNSIDHYLAEIERGILEKTLNDAHWNKTAAAAKLGISFRQLRYKLNKFGIK